MHSGNLWQAVLGEIELSVSRGNFMTWFKPTQLLKCDNDVAIIGVPNVFIRQQLERKYTTLIVETLQKNGVTPEKIEYKIYTSAAKKQPAEDPMTLQDNRPQQLTPAPRPADAMARPASKYSTDYKSTPLASSTSGGGSGHTTYRQGLNERYTFENFIEGSGNELAYAACQAIATSPGTKYNPLFLYGGVGIGKTHLMQAVGNAVLANNRSARIVYVSSEQFLQEFVTALRFKKISDFTEVYRTADVLIVDDVQFIAGKEKAQEEFFHTFNTLHQGNKQIIISSDKPPSDIPGLEDRLRSRFVWGMSIDMQIPDFETRCAIIQTKASTHAVELPPDVVEYLASHIQTNIRELEGALNQLLAFCEMRAIEPNLAIVSGLLGSAKTRPKHISAKQIIERTARHFSISVDEILSAKRDKDIVMPRQVAMYILRSELHLSFPKIARELGRKDHTTAIHSVEKIEKEIHVDNTIREAINDIKELLYA
ncbi:MAG TPA: chromosomal replication initiator protein DnaA [Candidatus Saccharimonadales bacterium]|jgi:chromosomal replication initiator protein